MSTSPTPAALITGLFETHLNVANLERSIEFYEQVLGLQLGIQQEARRVAMVWIGGWGKAMLGLWEKPESEIIRQHLAFEVQLADLDRTIGLVKRLGVQLRNFFEERTDVPTVFGWIPAASIYFDDPDGHALEFLAKLPGDPRPEIGVVSWDDWQRLTRPST